MIPNKKHALGLLLISGCSENVIQHCLKVSEHARKITYEFKENEYSVDEELVYIGALLHDIGRSKTHDIKHGIEGARLAEQYGLDVRLIRIINTHIGAGITNDEAKFLGFPPGNYVPSTLEEMIVAHADNLVEDNQIVTISEKTEILRKKGISEYIINRIVKLHNRINGMLY